MPQNSACYMLYVPALTVFVVITGRTQSISHPPPSMARFGEGLLSCATKVGGVGQVEKVEEEIAWVKKRLIKVYAVCEGLYHKHDEY